VNQTLIYDPLTNRLSLSDGNEVDITGVSPGGNAGGDLTGTYPNPLVGNNAITSAKILDGTITSSDILDANIASADLASNAVTTLKIADGAVTSTKLANTSVVAGSYGTATQVSQITVDAQGRITSADNVTITGAAPTGAAGGDLTGTYPNPTIAANAVSSTEIIDGTITTGDIFDGTITTADLANSLVTATKLANTTVTAGLYGTGTQVSQITVDAQGRITSAGNVTITGAAPTGAAGGDLTGTYPNPLVGNNVITSAKILDGTISSTDILDATIVSADLAINAVTTLKITDGAVTNVKLANTSVVPGSYGTGTQVPQILIDAQGRITSAANVTVTGASPTGAAGGDLTGTYPNPLVGNNAITSAKILDGTITSTDILDATIGTLDLANNAITTLKITDASVTNTKLANTTVTPNTYGTASATPQFTVDAQGRITGATNIAISGVLPGGAAGGDLTGTYPNPIVANNAITSAKILDGTITTSDILDATIANADLANNAVTTAKIIDGAVTNVKLANTTVVPGSYGTATQVSQITVDAQGRITTAANVAITGVAPTGTAGGDLNGTYPNPSVDRIQSNPINNAILAPADNGKALVWDGAQWIATVVPGLTPQTSYYSVDPSDFVILKSNNQTDKHNLVVFSSDNTFVSAGKDGEGEELMASLHLPHGAIVDQVIVYYWDSETTSMNFKLFRKNLNSLTNDVELINWNSGGSVTAIRTQTFAISETISNQIYTYRIVVDLNINSNSNFPSETEQRIYGVRIRYQH